MQSTVNIEIITGSVYWNDSAMILFSVLLIYELNIGKRHDKSHVFGFE
jgi:hypothetical protein